MSTAMNNSVNGSATTFVLRRGVEGADRAASARLRRLAWRAVGTVCFVIGAVNAFVPLLPTTVFWIVAVWAFSRSSPEFARVMLEHPCFGPALRHWRDHRMMSRRAKVLACSGIGVSYVVTLALLGVSALTLLVGTGLGGLVLYLATRREPRADAGGYDGGSLAATPQIG